MKKIFLSILCSLLLLPLFTNANSSKVITLSPGWNVVSTPALLSSIEFSNDGEGISFSKLSSGKWISVPANTTNIKPLEGFMVYSSNTDDVTMTFNYRTDVTPMQSIFQRNLNYGWDFVGITTTNSPFYNIGAAAVMSVDFTNNGTTNYTNKVAPGTNYVINTTSSNINNPQLGEAYGIFVNQQNAIYGGSNNLTDDGDTGGNSGGGGGSGGGNSGGNDSGLYTVTWLDRDGSTLEVDENVPAGTIPTYDGQMPTARADSSNSSSFIFSGWKPEIGPVTADTTYRAQMTSLVQDGQRRLNVLILGYGGENREGYHLIPDSVIVASWNMDTNEVTLISLPFPNYYSDLTISYFYNYYTYSNISRHTTQQLISDMKTWASKTLGLNIQNYVSVDFASFKEIIDILGGIDIYVDEPINDNQYPNDLKFSNNEAQYYRNTVWGYDPFSIGAGQQHLDGETALKYVRSINTTSNSDRAYRQQKVLNAIKEKVSVSGFDISQIYNLYKLTRYLGKIENDLSFSDSVWIARHLNKIESITSFEYSSKTPYVKFDGSIDNLSQDFTAATFSIGGTTSYWKDYSTTSAGNIIQFELFIGDESIKGNMGCDFDNDKNIQCRSSTYNLSNIQLGAGEDTNIGLIIQTSPLIKHNTTDTYYVTINGRYSDGTSKSFNVPVTISTDKNPIGIKISNTNSCGENTNYYGSQKLFATIKVEKNSKLVDYIPSVLFNVYDANGNKITENKTIYEMQTNKVLSDLFSFGTNSSNTSISGYPYITENGYLIKGYSNKFLLNEGSNINIYYRGTDDIYGYHIVIEEANGIKLNTQYNYEACRIDGTDNSTDCNDPVVALACSLGSSCPAECSNSYDTINLSSNRTVTNSSVKISNASDSVYLKIKTDNNYVGRINISQSYKANDNSEWINIDNSNIDNYYSSISTEWQRGYYEILASNKGILYINNPFKFTKDGYYKISFVDGKNTEYYIEYTIGDTSNSSSEVSNCLNVNFGNGENICLGLTKETSNTFKISVDNNNLANDSTIKCSILLPSSNLYSLDGCKGSFKYNGTNTNDVVIYATYVKNNTSYSERISTSINFSNGTWGWLDEATDKKGTLSLTASANAVGKVIAGGTSDFDTLRFSLSEDDITINTITLERYGYSNNSIVSSVWLENVDGTIITSKEALNSNGRATLTVKKDYKVNLGEATIVATLIDDNNSSTIGLKVVDIDSTAKTINYNNYSAKIYDIVSYQPEGATVYFNNLSRRYVYSSQEEYDLATFDIKCGVKCIIDGFTLTNNGDFDLSNIDKDSIKVYIGNTQVDIWRVTRGDNNLIISFDDEMTLSANKLVNIRVVGKITSLDESGKYLQLGSSDFCLEDYKNGTRIAVNFNGSTWSKLYFVDTPSPISISLSNDINSETYFFIGKNVTNNVLEGEFSSQGGVSYIDQIGIVGGNPGNDVIFHIYINNNLIENIDNNSLNEYIKIPIIRVGNGTSIPVKVVAEIDGTRQETLNGYSLVLVGIDDEEFLIDNASNEFSNIIIRDEGYPQIFDISTKDNQVVLNKNNPLIANFKIKPVKRGTTESLEGITINELKFSSIGTNNISNNDVIVKINGITQTSNNGLTYNPNYELPIDGVPVEIYLKSPIRGTFQLKLNSINSKSEQEIQTREFPKLYSEDALVEISNQENMGEYTRYTLSISTIDNNTTISNVKLWVNGTLFASHLGQINDGDTMQASNMSSVKYIDKITYTIISNGYEKDVIINKSDFPNFFKVGDYDWVIYGSTNTNSLSTNSVNENTNPDNTNPDTTNPDNTNPDNTNSDNTNPDNTNPDNTNPDNTNPDNTNPDNTNPDNTNSDTTNPDNTNSDTTNPDTSNPDNTNSDTTNPDTSN